MNPTDHPSDRHDDARRREALMNVLDHLIAEAPNMGAARDLERVRASIPEGPIQPALELLVYAASEHFHFAGH